jgi:hypothetical protein
MVQKRINTLLLLLSLMQSCCMAAIAAEAAAAAAAATIAATAAVATVPAWKHHEGLQPQHARLLTQRTHTVGSMPVYGNWCGPRYGSGVPVDALDRCCKQHDDCYDNASYYRCE